MFTINNNHLIVLIGKSASGKDSIAFTLEKEYNFKNVVSTTSRPMREGEVEGFNYYFKTKEEFEKMIKNNELIEQRSYKTIEDSKSAIWYYGISKDKINLKKKNHVVVVDLKGLKVLKERFGDKIISFYIIVDDDTRKERAKSRDENFELKEWNRRLETDKKDFEDAINQVDYIVMNDNIDKSVSEIVDAVKMLLENNILGRLYSLY